MLPDENKHVPLYSLAIDHIQIFHSPIEGLRTANITLNNHLVFFSDDAINVNA